MYLALGMLLGCGGACTELLSVSHTCTKGVIIQQSEIAENGLKGIIQKISFWGSFFEAKVLVKDIRIVLRLMKNEWKAGEEVFLNMNNNN